MTCQHPYCSRPRYSTCSNHCYWSLCSQHINEHKTLLFNEFEQVLQDLIKPTNTLSKSIEQMKETITKDQQNELDCLQKSHDNQLKILEQKLTNINRIKNQSYQISEHIIKIKQNESILTQYDFQQVENLIQEINQFNTPSTDTYISEKQLEPTYCPLTSLNVYGLSSSHNVQLCKSKKKIRYLFEHFRKYHHLTDAYANILLNAITENLDPAKTILFPSDALITNHHEKHPCPLQNTKKECGIRCTPCSDLVSNRYLPVHLKVTHHLRLAQIEAILKPMEFED
ncbi:hypothetical protein I4U23_007044 [Adineta vaga]|nr:hypothetical protein I4U23_007044 [Adineta vaga]